MKNIIITENEEGQRIDKFLKKYFKQAGNGFLYKMLRKKNIVLNKKKAAGSEKLVAGDVISIFMSEETIKKFRGNIENDMPEPPVVPIDIENDADKKIRYIKYKNYRIDILYEDEYIIFFNKPAGILSQKAKKDDISMVEILEAYLIKSGQTEEGNIVQKPGICNRLDRNTSGITACGKNLKGLQALTKAIREKSVSKYYICIVEGIPEENFIMKGYLAKDNDNNRVYISDILKDNCAHGKYVHTEFKVLERYKDKALMEAKLITGRTHQIRAHLSYKGYPVSGDVKYGAKKDGRLKHYLLHAYKLQFNKEKGVLAGVSEKSITAPVPEEFKKYIPD